MVTAVRERAPNVAYMKLHIPTLEVVWDTQGLQRGTFLEALQLMGDDAFVYLEDDVVLTQQFCKKAETAIRQKPTAVIQFFSRRQDDIRVGSRWQSGSVYLMNQCVHMPSGMGRAVAAYLPRWYEEQHRLLAVNPEESQIAGSLGRGGCDMMLRHFFKDNGIKHWVSIPSLVEHGVVPSVIDSRRAKKRQSKTFTAPELFGKPAELVL